MITVNTKTTSFSWRNEESKADKVLHSLYNRETQPVNNDKISLTGEIKASSWER